MKHVIFSTLFLSSLSLFAAMPGLEALSRDGLPVEGLPCVEGINAREIQCSTANIPARGSVVLSCEATLPHFSPLTYSFYVSPRAGDFGPIEVRFRLNDAYIVRTIGSKIYTTNNQYLAAPNATFFYITQVKQSNQAVVVDLSHMPEETTVNCTF